MGRVRQTAAAIGITAIVLGSSAGPSPAGAATGPDAKAPPTASADDRPGGSLPHAGVPEVMVLVGLGLTAQLVVFRLTRPDEESEGPPAR